MKMPIILWLAMLPPEVFDKAVANIEKQGCILICEKNEETTLASAIQAAFIFAYSNEGSDFWWYQIAIAPQTENREVK